MKNKVITVQLVQFHTKSCNFIHKLLRGNHEYYQYLKKNANFRKAAKTITQINEIIQNICDQCINKNVCFLNNSYAEIGNLIIAGTTLWYDADLEYNHSEFNDYKHIYVTGDNNISMI